MSHSVVRWIVLLAGASFALRAGGRGLANPDEGRYVEIAREMAATGDYLVPRIHGVPHWAKPPLVYWATAASLRLFGPVDWAARLPTILAAAFATWMVARAARRHGGEAAGAAAALVFASSLQIASVGSLLTTDMMLTACVAAAFGPSLRLWTMTRAEAAAAGGERLRLALGVSVALGVAFVAKGPVALGVFAAAWIIHFAFDPERRMPSLRLLALGAVTIGAIGLPWFLLVADLRPGLAAHFLAHEVRDRIATGTHGRERHWAYFLALFPLGLAPWTGAFFLALRAPKDDPAPRLRRASLCWIAGGFLLFQASGSKLPTYLAPLYPAVAVLLGLEIASVGRRPFRGGSPTSVATGLAVLVTTAALIAADRGLPTTRAAIATGMIAAAGACALVGLRGRTRFADATIAATLVFALLQVAHHTADVVEPWSRSPASRAEFGRAIGRLGLRGDPIPTAVTAAETSPPPSGDADRVVFFRRTVNSLPFHAFGLRPEVVTTYDSKSLWEIPDDAAADRGRTAEALAARIAAAPLQLILRSDELPDLERISPRPLTTLARSGVGRAEMLLVRAE